LMFNMIARLAERGNADLERNPYIWQLEKLNDMHLLTEESVKMISEKAGVAEEIFRDVIENEGYRIYKDSHEQLTTALKSNALPDPQVQASLNALVNQTMFEVDNLLNITLPKSIRRSFEQAVLGSVAGVVTG
ncbi:capsid protein, partial [Streptococcus danieliae]|nr:capsid protein [Streptococcus danieliae]